MDILTFVPFIFVLYLLLIVLFTLFLRKGENRSLGNLHERDPYASGQRNVDHLVHPTYYRTFAYAFFFTVMHVLVLVIATAPRGEIGLPLVYVAFGVLAMIILLKKHQPDDEVSAEGGKDIEAP